MILLGVNVDHVATIREARKTSYPCPVEAALLAIKGGADQITIHLREDRRHIKDSDLTRMKAAIDVPLNLEMANSPEIVDIACRVRPSTATLVPERREELTTEGGLDVLGNESLLAETVKKLSRAGISVSMFIDPDLEQVDASLKLGARAIELHTGRYCNTKNDEERAGELERLKIAAARASKIGLKVAAGHGLNYNNTADVVSALPWVTEYNIGHSIVARSVHVGIERAVKEMKNLMGDCGSRVPGPGSRSGVS